MVGPKPGLSIQGSDSRQLRRCSGGRTSTSCSVIRTRTTSPPAGQEEATRAEREAQVKRIAEEQERVAVEQRKTARLQRWSTRLLVAIAIVVVGAGSWIVMQAREVGRQTSLVLATAARDASDAGFHDRALRFAVLAARSSWFAPAAVEAESQLARAARSSTMVAQLSGHTGSVESAAFSPDGQRVVTASSDKTARVWDVTTGKELARFLQQDSVSSAAFSPDGQRVGTASFDQTARVWDATTGKELLQLKGHGGPVVSVAFSPDGQRVVTASEDETARVWHADGTGKEVVLQGHEDRIMSAAFSPDGRSVVTASADTTARVWRADGTDSPVVLQGHQSIVTSAAFSPDGRSVVTASVDTTARVWRADGTGLPVVLQGHEDRVTSAAFSPDGQRVVTASWDTTARVWRADGTGLPEVLRGHQDRVTSAAFSPDGQRVVTASEDKTVRVSDMHWLTQYKGRELIEAVCQQNLVGARILNENDVAAVPILSGHRGEDVCAPSPFIARLISTVQSKMQALIP